jgi:4-hydroxy-tetrahydrodipicolinate reductase
LGDKVAETQVVYSNDIKALVGSDAVIDFSNPETSTSVVEWCAENGVPLLVATTGHSDSQLQIIREFSCRLPIALVPNTSVGAAALTTLAENAKRLLGPSFDIEVLELHHKMKRDAPSGTARSIVESIAEPSNLVFGRQEIRKSGEVGIVSIRGGDVVGDHTVYFLGHGERIEISHRVIFRSVFGSGDIYLAEKLLLKPFGLYSARDLLV